MDPKDVLLKGCDILDAVLVPRGFNRTEINAGKGSGGWFANCRYRLDDRSLELHFRYSLGLVAYHLSDLTVSHTAYMKHATMGKGGNRYPGYSDDPLNAFKGLAYDLEHFATDFLDGSCTLLVEAAEHEAERMKKKQALSHRGAYQLDRTFKEVRRLLKEGDYEGVLNIYNELSGHKLELLTPGEEKMIEIAKERSQKS